MKQLLFLLFTFFCCSSSVCAQKQKVATFDFTYPTKLTPEIDIPSSYKAMDISAYHFSEGKISVSFTKGLNQVLGAMYKTDGNNEYYLQLNKGTVLSLQTSDDAKLDSIQFEVVDAMYDFNLSAGMPGSLPIERYRRFWSKNENEIVTAVSFYNSGMASDIKRIKVFYKEPIAVLMPNSTDFQSTTLPSFSQGHLTFSSNIIVKSNNGAYLADNDGNKHAVSISSEGKVVTVSVGNEISTDGIYTLFIPEGCLSDSDGYTNKTLTYEITINTPKNTFNFISSEPTSGSKIDKLTDKFSITFPDAVGFVKTKPLLLYKDQQPKLAVVMSKDSEDNKQVIFNFQNVTGDLTEPGSYTIDVPEEYIYNAFQGIDGLESLVRYNQAFQLVYEISATPEPDPTPEDSETMKKAKELIALSGVGYPTADSDSKKQLIALTEAETVPSDDALNTAIVSLYEESDVQLPTAEKYYTIANINSSKDTLYVSIDGNDNVLLTSEFNQAAAFLCSNENGKFSFKSQNGKFFYVKGLTTDKGKLLKLKKFDVSGFDAESLFGTFSIQGYSRTNSDNIDLYPYAMVNHKNEGSISTDDTSSKLHFDAEESNAFILKETKKPADENEAVDFEMYLNNKEYTDNNGLLQLTTKVFSQISLNTENNTASLLNDEKKEILKLTMSKGSDNSITIPFSQLSNGTYYVKIPKGCFTGNKNGQQFLNNEFELMFIINKKQVIVPENPEFSLTYNSFLYVPSGADYYKDVDLNTFSITEDGAFDGFVVDENKIVELVQPDTYKTIRTGHFKKINYLPGYPQYTNAYQVQFDIPINSGDLVSDRYTIVISEATFGDNNFAKYLADPTSIDSKMCKVNPVMRMTFKVDNDKATGIKDITTDIDRPTIIYDLMGRRVKSMTRPGIYIVNGKKVVKK